MVLRCNFLRVRLVVVGMLFRGCSGVVGARVAGPKLKHRNVSSVSVTSLTETPFNLEHATGIAHSYSAPLLNESLEAVGADDELPSPRPHHRKRLKLHRINGDGTDSDVSSAVPPETNLDGLSLSSQSTVTSQSTPRSHRADTRSSDGRGDTLTRETDVTSLRDEAACADEASAQGADVSGVKRGIHA